MHLFGKKRNNEYGIVAKSEYFDGEWYLKTYPDVAAAKMDPVEHYMVYGWKENRNPGPNFNTNEYLEKYPECKICPLIDMQLSTNNKSLINVEYVANPVSFIPNETFLSNKSLSVQQYDDAIVLPIKRHNANPYFMGGVLDKDGNYIQTTSLEDRITYNNYPLPDTIPYIDEEVIYIGCFWNHYGHFILELVSYLWYAIKNTNSGLRFCYSYIDNGPLPSYALEFLSLLGIKEDALIQVKTPTKFKKIWIPDHSVSSSIFYTNEYKMIYDRIAENITPIKNDKIYLSRTHFGKAKETEFGEEYIEKLFAKNGFKIIYPEELSFSEQIAIIRGAKTVACVCGTLMHQMLFAEDGANLIIVNKRPTRNRPQWLINELRNLHVTYIDAYVALPYVILGFGPFLIVDSDLLHKFIKDNNFKDVKYPIKKIQKNFDGYIKKWKEFANNNKLFRPVSQEEQNDEIDKFRKKYVNKKTFNFKLDKGWNKYFDTNYYLATYPDIKKAGVNPIEHYSKYGWKEGRNPSKYFDTNFYLTQYPDIARANINPLEHYLEHGKDEGRICTPEKSFKKNFLSYLNEAVAEIEYIEYEYGIIEKDEKTSDEYTVLKNSDFFDKKYYLQKYPEVKNSGLDPITHYLTIGYKEGKNPSKYFDNNFYLTMHKDIAMANMNPLLHYLEHGKKEGRVIAEPYELSTTTNHTKIHNPLISIIVASYNYEKYITETLDSLLAQTYKNFEIIVVDDGSKDKSVSVIQEYTNKYPNVRLYQHEKGKNKGLVETIKLGISKAKGDYIAFCESDDCWIPEHLQEKVNLIEQYGSPELISNDVELFDHPTKEYEDYLNYGIRRFSPGICPINILHLKLFNPVATFSAAMFRADILRSCNFDSVIPAWTDWWLYRQILINYPLYYVNKRLTKWRIHDSYNKTENSEKRNEKLDEFIFYSNVLLAQTNKYVLRSMKSDNDYKIVSKSRLFNARWYTRQHPEIKKLGVPPAVHFNYVGWRRGFDPSPKFCVDAYLGIYHDIKIWGVNPLVHYLKFGMKEGRWIVGSDVKVKKYLSDDTDIIYKKNILLVSHELSRTGAPMLLMQVAELLKKQNFKVTILSPIDGEIHKDIVDKGIDLVIDAKAFFKQDQLQKDFNKKFDFCICNTYINAGFYSRICAITPSILWIHDNLNEVCAKAIMPVLSKSKNIYAPSKLTKSYIEKYNDNIKILPYPIKDVAPTLHDKTNKKMRIAVVAALQPRKGQDIFIQAIKSLPKDIRAQAEFLILGKETFGGYIDELKKIANGMPELKFVPSKNNFQEYHDFIESLDVLCCPSREDPCPLVVIDAFMHSVPVIISDHVGQKELITNGEDGYIFENENISELASVLEKMIINKDNLSELQQKSRQLFENNFSEELFFKQLKKIMRKTCKESL